MEGCGREKAPADLLCPLELLSTVLHWVQILPCQKVLREALDTALDCGSTQVSLHLYPTPSHQRLISNYPSSHSFLPALTLPFPDGLRGCKDSQGYQGLWKRMEIPEWRDRSASSGAFLGAPREPGAPGWL